LSLIGIREFQQTTLQRKREVAKSRTDVCNEEKDEADGVVMPRST